MSKECLLFIVMLISDYASLALVSALASLGERITVQKLGKISVTVEALFLIVNDVFGNRGMLTFCPVGNPISSTAQLPQTN